MVEISEKAFEGMKRHAERGYPHEVCGVMIGSQDSITEFAVCVNLNSERSHDRYELDPLSYIRADTAARNKNLHIVGIYHSHPDHPARPSETDRRMAERRWGYLILSIRKGAFQNAALWYLNEETEQFTQRDFSVRG